MHEVLYIVVIYGISQEESRAWQCLHQLLDPETFERCVYVHDNTSHNVYLAEAYNQGLAYAVKHGFDYIVLLDDDAAPTAEYVRAVRQIVESGDQHGVWAPLLENAQHKRLSPRRRWGMKVAFNSGMLLPVARVQEIGGFNTAYPLDYLDYWVCYRLQEQGTPLHTLPVILRHDLSVNDYTRVSRERYLSLLQAERQFAQDSKHRCRYRMLLTARLVKWLLTGHPYCKETYEALIRR